MEKYDVVVIGGGLAGLTAANYLVNEGKKVVILEKSNRFGGRAITKNKSGIHMNLGAHALYLEGEAMRTFTELGIAISGKNASKSVKIHGIWKDAVHLVPTNISSIITSSLLSWRAKIMFSGLMLKVMKININSIPRLSLASWAEKEISDPMVRHIFYSICRLTTYINAPTLQLAKPVLRQVKSSLKTGVLYVDGGWNSIIQELKRLASEAGAEMIYSKKVVEIKHHEQSQSIRCSDGTVYHASYCIVATPPKEALKMINGADHTSLRLWNEQAIPITASCLDLGVKKLPNPRHQFAIGLDQSLFFTNQSRAAKLSDDGSSVVSLVSYHTPMDKKINPLEEKRQLESVMDFLHPKWGKEVVVQQYLPKITVVHDFAHINRKENPGPMIPEMRGMFIAGDWAGHEELLADAAVASGKRAALQILQQDE